MSAAAGAIGESLGRSRPGSGRVHLGTTDFVLMALGAALALSLFLPWFTVARPPNVGPHTVDGWQAFSHVDIGIGVAGALAALSPLLLPSPVSRLFASVCGIGAAVLVLRSVVSLPIIPPVVTAVQQPSAFIQAAGTQVGPYLSLAVALALGTLAGWDASRARPRLRALEWPSERTVLLGLIALGAVLRFSTLGVQSYWYDELATVEIVSVPFHAAVHVYLHTESTPPLYYLLAWAWTHLFGTGEYGLRSLSALFGTVTIPVTYLAGRHLVSRSAGLAAAAFVAVNPTLVWFSQEARAYSLLVLAASVSLLLLARTLEAPTSRNVLLWTVSAVVALLTHYYALFLIAAEILVLLVRLRKRPRTLAPIAAAPAAVLALLPLIDAQGGGVRTNFIAGIPLGHRVGQIAKELISSNTLVINANTSVPGQALGYLSTAAIAIAVGWALFAFIRSRRPTGACVPALLGGLALLVPLVLTQLHHDYFLDRNLLPAWIALAIALGAALSAIPKRAAIVASLVIVAAGVAVDLDVANNAGLQRSDWRHTVALFGRHPGSRVIVVVPSYTRGIVQFYGVPSVPIPAGGVRTRELDVIGAIDVAAEPAVFPGFIPYERRTLQSIGLVFARSQQPITITPQSAAAHGIDPASLMVALTPASIAWYQAYFGELVALRALLLAEAAGAEHGAVDTGAIARLTAAQLALKASLSSPPPQFPNARSMTAGLVATTAGAIRWASALTAAGNHPSPAFLLAGQLDSQLRQTLGPAALAGVPSATQTTQRLLGARTR